MLDFLSHQNKSPNRLYYTLRAGESVATVRQTTHIYSGVALKSFWDGVRIIIREVLGYDIEFSCLSFYLGNVDLEISKADRYLLQVFMAASEKAITRRWLRKEPPTVKEWSNIVTNIQCMERLTFSLRLQKDRGDAF